MVWKASESTDINGQQKWILFRRTKSLNHPANGETPCKMYPKVTQFKMCKSDALGFRSSTLKQLNSVETSWPCRLPSQGLIHLTVFKYVCEIYPAYLFLSPQKSLSTALFRTLICSSDRHVCFFDINYANKMYNLVCRSGRALGPFTLWWDSHRDQESAHVSCVWEAPQSHNWCITSDYIW